MLRSKQFKAILFDIDGTLLDTLQDLADSMNGALHRLGFPTHNLDEYKYFVGDGMENLVKRALPERARNDPRQVSGCLQILLEIYGRNWKAKTRPYPGIPELLDALSARGLKMAVLSNKLHGFTVKVVAELLAAWHFEPVLGERASAPRKPDPTSALEIARVLGIEPADFLYLGDTATDMKTAKGAGMFAVGALWGFRDSEELIAGGADKLISEPTQLLDLL
ncbi:MAG: HAD family hydrolase [Syntrophobacteraceae bacterium]|nr:HAD family hydrolase [Syntrophobacteraceae bacterium]